MPEVRIVMRRYSHSRLTVKPVTFITEDTLRELGYTPQEYVTRRRKAKVYDPVAHIVRYAYSCTDWNYTIPHAKIYEMELEPPHVTEKPPPQSPISEATRKAERKRADAVLKEFLTRCASAQRWATQLKHRRERAERLQQIPVPVFPVKELQRIPEVVDLTEVKDLTDSPRNTMHHLGPQVRRNTMHLTRAHNAPMGPNL